MDNLLGGRQVLRHAPIREQVASIIRDAIVSMQLKPGQLLVERQLCEMTSASRPSVREALRQLETEGLVESLNGRGTIVATIDRELAENIYETRAELEGLAASLFVKHATAEERAALHAAIEELAGVIELGSNTEAILEAKNHLYDALFLGAHNPILYQFISMLQRRVSLMRSKTLDHPGRPAESLRELQDMVAAIEAGDADRARAATTHHVQQAARIILPSIAERVPQE